MTASIQRPSSGNAKEDAIVLYTSSGRGTQTSFNAIQPGMSVQEVAISELPESPIGGIWKLSGELYAVGFATRTIYLRVGDSIEEEDSQIAPFPVNLVTVYAGELDTFGSVLVHHHGWIQRGSTGSVEWRAPSPVLVAAGNQRQLAVALTDSTLVYFELASSNGQLREAASVRTPASVSCLALGPVPEGRIRSRFLVLGGSDSVVRLLSCDPDDRMTQLALQAAAHPPTSLMFMMMDHDGSHGLYLHVGLKSGVHVRLSVNSTNGSLSDAQSRFLGVAPVRFFPGSPCIALSSKPWMLTSQQHLVPLSIELSTEAVVACAPFSTVNIPEALILVTERSFRIVMPAMAQSALLPFSGRRRIVVTDTIRRIDSCGELAVFCLAKCGEKSVIRIVDAASLETRASIELFGSLIVICATLIQFSASASSTGWYLIAGCSTGYDRANKTCKSAMLLTCTFDPENGTITEMHRTDCGQSVPHSVHRFVGKLLVGFADHLCLYDLGKQRLLRKCESPTPSAAVLLDSQGCRVYVGTAAHSLLFYVYRPRDNALQCFADDVVPRPITAMTILDYETVAVGGLAWVASRCFACPLD